MFGELVGIWLADLWQRAGRPDGARYVELGPGRGTLAADALRAMRGAGLDAAGRARRDQPGAARAPRRSGSPARWHDDLVDACRTTARCSSSPTNSSTRCRSGSSMTDGRELRTVDWTTAASCATARSVTETSPASLAIVGRPRPAPRRAGRRGADRRLRPRPAGRAATRCRRSSRHAYADPFDAPGERDLTAHVDFAALGGGGARRGRARLRPGRRRAPGSTRWGSSCAPPRSPRPRPSAPPRSRPARDRLTAPDQMGRLFKAMALVAPGWPEPAGF